MSNERRLEYDKGPSLDDREDPDEPADALEDDPSRGQPTARGRRLIVDVAPWKVGLVSGVSAFAVAFAVTYQLVASMIATGLFTQADNEPSQWVVAAFTLLGSHGAPIEDGGEPIQGAFGYAGSLVSHVSALVPIAILVLAGYLLVRHLRLETARDVGLLGVTLTASYVAVAVVLATVAEWSPQETEPAPGETGPEPETLAVTVDASMLLSVTLSVVLFAGLGAAIASLPRLLEYAPVETTTDRAS